MSELDRILPPALARAEAHALATLAALSERAGGPQRPVLIPLPKEPAMNPLTDDRVLSLAPLPDVPATAITAHEASVASARAASAAQQTLLTAASGVPQAPVEPVVSAAAGYTKTRLGTIVLGGHVGASQNVIAKTGAG